MDFVTWKDDGGHKLREGRWWLVPWWAKEMPKQAMFNARIETVATSGRFKNAIQCCERSARLDHGESQGALVALLQPVCLRAFAVAR